MTLRQWLPAPYAPPQLTAPYAQLQLSAPPNVPLPQTGAGSSAMNPSVVYTMPTSSLGRPDVVSGTLRVDSHDALVLFDSGATFSFVSLDFVKRANLSSHEISQSVPVSSLGGMVSSSVVCPGCVISIDGDDFVVNLMVISLPIFDVILGMDWLHRYRAVISCF
jgi:hypothetical protein